MRRGWELRAAFAARLAAVYGCEVPGYRTLVEAAEPVNADVLGAPVLDPS